MKFKIFILLLVIMTAVAAPLNVSAARNITLFVNNEKIACDVAPIISNDRTLVPARALFEAFGASVEWNDSKKQATVNYSGTTVILTINSVDALVNGKTVKLDAAPIIINSRTMLPIRFVAESLGYEVSWDDKNSYVYVSSPAEPVKNKIKKAYTTVTDTEMQLNLSFTDKLSSYELFPMSNPSRIVLDVAGCVYASTATLPVSKGGVTQIRMANREDSVRFVVDLESMTSYDFKQSADGLSATLKVQLKRDDNVPVPDGDLSKIVVIDAGHGGSDAGAIGYDKDGNAVLKEKDVNLDVSQKVVKYLKEKGITVYETRPSDVYVPLQGRTDYANDLKAGLFVSIHTNSFTSSDVNGTLTLYSSSKDELYPNLTSSKSIAKAIQNKLYNLFGTVDKGTRSEDELYVLRHTTMPAVLVELAFISNESDRAILADPDRRSDAAWAIACSIEEIITK